MIALSNILEVWLKQKGSINSKKFYIEYNNGYDLIKCKSCGCFTAFVRNNLATLRLRFGPGQYDTLAAVDHEFLSKLERHLIEHICDWS